MAITTKAFFCLYATLNISLSTTAKRKLHSFQLTAIER